MKFQRWNLTVFKKEKRRRQNLTIFKMLMNAKKDFGQCEDQTTQMNLVNMILDVVIWMERSIAVLLDFGMWMELVKVKKPFFAFEMKRKEKRGKKRKETDEKKKKELFSYLFPFLSLLFSSFLLLFKLISILVLIYLLDVNECLETDVRVIHQCANSTYCANEIGNYTCLPCADAAQREVPYLGE